MKSVLLNVNVLIALIDPSHEFRDAAHAWFERKRRLAGRLGCYRKHLFANFGEAGIPVFETWKVRHGGISAGPICGHRTPAQSHKGILREGADAMDVHFPPEVQTRLEQMARDTGRRSSELVENVVKDFFDEISFTQETLTRRYDDMESGNVKPIPGDEVFARLRAKSSARRGQQHR